MVSNIKSSYKIIPKMQSTKQMDLLVLGSAANRVLAVNATEVLLPFRLDEYRTSMYEELELSLSATKTGLSLVVRFIMSCSAVMLYTSRWNVWGRPPSSPASHDSMSVAEVWLVMEQFWMGSGGPEIRKKYFLTLS